MPLILLLGFSSPVDVYAARVERDAFQSEHFEYLIDKSKTDIIPYLSGRFENSYRRLTEYFSYQPKGRIRVLFLDEDDFSNGYAFSAQGWIVIYLPRIDFDLRGNTAWLPNVISHELTHVITLRKAGETSRFLGVRLLASLAFQKAVELDGEASIPWQNTPSWFSEGLAQHGSRICGHDTVDAIRKMVLYTAFASGALLPYPEMATFGWDVRTNEMIYTQGFFLVEYLFEKYGPDKLNSLLPEMGRSGFESAFKNLLGKYPDEEYRDWIAHLDSTVTRGIRSPAPKALIPVSQNAPYVNQSSPVKSNGGTLAFLSSQRNDYGLSDLYIEKGGKIEVVKKGVEGRLNLSPDGKILYFIYLSWDWKTARLTRDLYQYEFSSREISRLTWNGRITSAAPVDSGTVYTLSENGGRTRFSRLDENGLIPIADYPVSVNVAGLAQGNVPNALLAEVATGRGTDIYSLEVSDGHLRPILASGADERDPRWSRELQALLFSADYTGTYQIFSLRNDTLLQLTQGEKNHFDPLSHAGNLFTSNYSTAGFMLDSLSQAGLSAHEFHADTGLQNQPFAEAAPVEIAHNKWGDDGMKFLGYSAFGRISRVPKQRNVFGATHENSLLYGVNNPGDYFKWTAGGAGILMHPGSESQMYLQAGLSDELDPGIHGGPYFSDLLADYSNRSFGPILNGTFESSTMRLIRQTGGNNSGLVLTLIRLSLSLDWRLNNYLSTATFGGYSGVSLKDGDGLQTDFAGGGTFFGEQVLFSLYQPGVNFPNRLLALQSGIGYSPGGGSQGMEANWNDLTLATNSFRRIFYRISASTVTLINRGAQTDFKSSGSIGLDIPSAIRIPLPASRSFYLTDLLPSLGVFFNSQSNSGSSSSAAASAIRRIHPQNPGTAASSMQPELSNAISNGQVDMMSSISLKMISPLKNLVYWKFFYAFPVAGNPRDAYFGLTLDF